MPLIQSFSPVIGTNPTVLILGSMPGVESLNKQQYYAHPRNAFWPIMAQLLNVDWPTDYPARIRALQCYPVILWDVLQSCERSGSLDSAISQQGVVANQIPQLIRQHADLQALVFNGATSEKMFRKHVLPRIEKPERFELLKMPSTSPAHASKNLQQKLRDWQQITRFFPTAD